MTIKALQLPTKQHRATMASTKEMKEEKENSNRKKEKKKVDQECEMRHLPE